MSNRTIDHPLDPTLFLSGRTRFQASTSIDGRHVGLAYDDADMPLLRIYIAGTDHTQARTVVSFDEECGGEPEIDVAAADHTDLSSVLELIRVAHRDRDIPQPVQRALRTLHDFLADQRIATGGPRPSLAQQAAHLDAVATSIGPRDPQHDPGC